MGARSNIVIHDGDNPEIYFYSHWAGDQINYILADALRRGRSRWDDGSYLARIIFCEMIKNEVLDTSGYGISTYLCDNEYPLVHVFIPDTNEEGYVEIEGMPRMAFEKYIELFN